MVGLNGHSMFCIKTLFICKNENAVFTSYYIFKDWFSVCFSSSADACPVCLGFSSVEIIQTSNEILNILNCDIRDKRIK